MIGEPEGCEPDNVKRSCERTEACGEGRTCVENTRSNGTTYAACAIGGKGGFDERCDRDFDATFCDGERWIRCHGRYHEEEVDCTSLGRVCEQLTVPRAGAFGTEKVAKCVESHAHDEGCAAATATRAYGARCEGDSLLLCFGPLVGARKACREEGRFCRPVEGGAACVLQPEKDPRCVGRDPLDDSYCDGDVAVLCLDGWRTQTKDCAAEGKRCAELLDVGSSSPYVRCVE